jgi:transposase
MPPSARLIGDKGYDANHFRNLLEERGTEAVIPGRTSRKQPFPLDPIAYKGRNRIERMFGRLKDFRRVATRYDKLARNYLAAVAIAAIVIWWIN